MRTVRYRASPSSLPPLLPAPGLWSCQDGGTLSTFLQHNGRNTVRFRVEYDKPLTDDRRRELTCSCSSLECGRQIPVARGHLLADENGTVRANLAL